MQLKTLLILIVGTIVSSCSNDSKLKQTNHVNETVVESEVDDPILDSIPEVKASSDEQQKSCLTIENFNLIASFIEEHGEQIKISERLMSDKESMALEISVGGVFIHLTNYQDYKKIIVIDQNEETKFRPYFLANENNEIQTSAYYSSFESSEFKRKITEDWCSIVAEIIEKR